MYYNTLEEAKTVGMKKSKKNLKGYSIHKRNAIHKNGGKFYLYGEEKQKCHDTHQYYCHNYETPFEVRSRSPKSGEHIDCFATKEKADTYFKGLLKDNYRRDIAKRY